MIASNKPQNRNPRRAQEMNRFTVNDFFSKFRATVEELGTINKQGCIYNVDEK
jgi:hypothetical protein